MNKKVFEDELITGMEQELVKNASNTLPNLSKAAECLHAALEIFEEQGLTVRADQILQLLEKINKDSTPTVVVKTAKIQSLQQLMEAGVTQRDLREFSKGNPIAIAKLNLILRKLGIADHEIAKFLGPYNFMSEEHARKALNPNKSESILEFKSLAPQPPSKGETLEFQSLATPGKKKVDPHTKGLTPEKEVENYKHHGTPFNMADDNCAIEIPPPINKDKLDIDDMEADFVDMLTAPTFDIDASDDELMGMDIKEDCLEVFEKDIPIEDFEDERD